MPILAVKLLIVLLVLCSISLLANIGVMVWLFG